MSLLRNLSLTTAFATTALTLCAQNLAPIRAKCEISASSNPGKFSLHVFDRAECADGEHCNSNMNHEPVDRLTGITLADLDRDGAHVTATITRESGTFTCTGNIHDHQLYGDALFTPNSAFVDRMAKLGFTGYDSQKLEAYTLLDVTSDYARSLQQAHIEGINADNLLAMRIFKIDPAYAQSFVSMGYEQPDADKLIGLKVQGVNSDEVRQIRALGFQPTLDELIQIRIFHITPEFIHSMQNRGLKDLTISKLVQIRIFKLAE